MKHLIALLALLALVPAHAATYYFSDCGTDADFACVVGDDSRTEVQAQDPATPWRTWAAAARPSVSGAGAPAGNVFRFACGGSWNAIQISIYIPAGTVSTPTVWESYTPSWFAGDCSQWSTKPILKAQGATASVFYWFQGGTVSMDGHYIVRDITVRGFNYGAATADLLTGNCIRFYGGVSDVELRRVQVAGCDGGVVVSGFSAGAGAAGAFTRINLFDSWVHHNSGNGWFGGSRGGRIENNLFEYNAARTTGTDPHNLYVSTSSPEPIASNGMVVRGNTLRFNGKYSGSEPACGVVNFVAHGTLPDLTVEGNTITESGAGSGCWAISLNGNTSSGASPQDFSRLLVRNNLVVFENAVGGASGIGGNRMPSGIIENNTVIYKGGAAGIAINIPDGGTGTTYFQTSRGDVPETFVTIRNNSVYIDGSGSSARGVKLLWDAISATPDPGTGGDVITGNLVYMTAASSASARCFEISTTRAIGTYGAFDRNLCYRVDADAVWSALHSTLALAQAAGFDTNSSKADPTLTATPAAGNSWSMAVNTGSPAINACSAACSRTARERYLANGTRDIGSHEFGATVQAPVGPSAGRAQ